MGVSSLHAPDGIENARQHRRFDLPVAAEPVIVLRFDAPFGRLLEERSMSGSAPAGALRAYGCICTLIEHHNPLRYCYLQVRCSVLSRARKSCAAP